MNDFNAMGKLVPGFEFLQSLVKGAGAAMPTVGQWVAPTLDPAELERRIADLRTVQFWLEQNAHMLATTIQALEVQRMTLSTLQTMNVSFSELTEALKVRTPEPAARDAQSSASTEQAAAPSPAAPAGLVDPMQWWSALTQQFTQIATKALTEGVGDFGLGAPATAAAAAPSPRGTGRGKEGRDPPADAG